MQDDEHDGLGPDDELELPEVDELELRRRENQKVDLPVRSKSSPLLRRVILGDAKGKSRGVTRKEAKRSLGGSGVIRRELGGSVRSEANRSDDVADADDVSPGSADGLEEATREVSSGPIEAEPAAEPVAERSVEVGGSEVSVRADAPERGGVRRRRRKTKIDQEAEWEGSERSSSSGWLLRGGILCLLVVAAAVFVVVRKGGFGKGEAPREKSPTFVSKVSLETLPIAEFVEQSAELLPVVREILVKVESGEGGVELLRGGKESAERLKEWRTRYPARSRFRVEGVHEIHASGNDRFAYLVMTGEREDFSRVMAYFVKEDGRMQLDWEATEGYGEVLIKDVEVLKDGKPRLMRGAISLSNFYTDIFPEEKFRCYTLHHDDPSEWLWAFAERGSDVDLSILSHMRLLDPLGRGRRVTVKISGGPEGSRANQVEITEFLFGDWLAPPAREEKDSDEG